MKLYKLGVLTSHPIQYQAPLWRRLAQHPQIDLTVYFCSDYGVIEKVDPGFGVKFKWDIPLLEGYRYKFLKNYSPKPALNGFWGLVNIGIVKELYKNRYDAVFVHSYAYATHLLAILAARLKGIKVLVRSDLNLNTKITPLRKGLKRLILPPLFKIVTACMAIGTLNKEYYRYYGVPKKKIFLMPYAVDNDFFFQQSDELLPFRDEIKGSLGIEKSNKVILYVGKFLKRKRPFDLIQAFENLGSSNAVLVMVGDGEERENCKKYVKSKGIANVHFVGFRNQSELPRFYAIADVFVLPSDQEPWGLVINEAMCFRLPIIGTDEAGACKDLIKQGKNGFVFKAGDKKVLSNCLEIILNKKNSQKMGIRSGEIIRCWGYRQNIETIIKVLD